MPTVVVFNNTELPPPPPPNPGNEVEIHTKRIPGFFSVHKDDFYKPCVKACVFSQYTPAGQLDDITFSCRVFIRILRPREGVKADGEHASSFILPNYVSEAQALQ